MSKDTKEYRESVLEYYRDNVLLDYKAYQKNFRALEWFIGETIGIAQEVEYEIQMAAERTGKAKKLLDLLGNRDFFDIEDDKKDTLIKKLKNVIDCRNWLAHTSLAEMKNKVIEEKNCFNDLFQSLAKEIGLFKDTEYEKLSNNIISNNWGAVGTFVGLNMEKKDRETTYIHMKQDWICLKVLMTKYILFELQDALYNNPVSIFAE